MYARTIAILLIIFFAGGVSAQAQKAVSGADLTSQLDTKGWKKFELNNLTILLPSSFELVQRQCIHYPCDVFKSEETSLVLEKGSAPYPSDRVRELPDFTEATLKVKEELPLSFTIRTAARLHITQHFLPTNSGILS